MLLTTGNSIRLNHLSNQFFRGKALKKDTKSDNVENMIAFRYDPFMQLSVPHKYNTRIKRNIIQ